MRILQEKEAVLHRLEEENANLERQMQEERKKLQERLQVTEEHKEELQQQVEAKENEIRVKEEQQRKAEWERQKIQEELTLEQIRLLKELERVKDALTEKEKNNSALSSELKQKEEELNERLAKVAAEVEENSSAARQEVLKQLEQVQEEKRLMEEQLMLAQAQDQAQMNDLQESLQTLEAQKLSLEQELKSTEVATACARKEVVESVSDVLENEFQCPICNELFMTAVMLNCSHTFCRYCIDQWKKNKKECPNCRQAITSETRSLVVDNFIEKIVPTLSEELKQRRAELVEERNAEMAAAAAAAAAAAEASRGRRAGRGRAPRGGRGRQRQGAPPVPASLQSTRPPAYPLVAVHHGGMPSSNFLTILRGRGPSGRADQAAGGAPSSNFLTFLRGAAGPSGSTNARPLFIHLPGASTQEAMHERQTQPHLVMRAQPGTERNTINLAERGPTPRRPLPGRRGHWANGCPEGAFF